MPLETGVIVTLLLAGAGGIAWAVRVESKVLATDKRVDEVRDDIAYIRQRIDQALNGKR